MLVSTRVGKTLLAERIGLNSIQKRYNVKEQLSRYHEPDQFKKHMLAACEPYYKHEHKLPSENCKSASTKQHELHPLDILYGDELIERINQTNAILFIQHNYCKFDDERVYKNRITKLGGLFHTLNNMCYKYVFEKLGRQEAIHLFVCRNALITGNAQSIPSWMAALNKMPEYTVLAGSLDGNLVSLETLKSITKDRDLLTSRVNLSMSLSLPGSTLRLLLDKASSNEKKVD